jgi:hypothetical protein
MPPAPLALSPDAADPLPAVVGILPIPPGCLDLRYLGTISLRGRLTGMTATAKRQAPLKIDPATDELISQAAHFLGMTKKDFVAEATRAYLEQRREEIRKGMVESMKLLDGSLTSSVAMLTGLSPERIEELGGVGDWEE